MGKMYTYHIVFETEEGDDSIRFCAPGKEEAIELFNYWCLMDANTKVPYEITSIEPVYDEGDAVIYGEDYGGAQ